MAIRELWRYKKAYSTPYPVLGANSVATPNQIQVELTKYVQEDFISRIIMRVVGNVTVAGSGPGTPTGKDNPEGILVSVNQTTTPQLNALNPVTNLSARGLIIDSAFMRGYLVRGTAIPDVAGVYPVDFEYEIYFKRPNVRKGVEWSHSIAKYSSDLLVPLFGGREQLFTGGTNTWDLSALQVAFYVDSDFAVDADRIHNHEFFERNYPILASQTDFPIDTLPQGFLYTDMFFLAEQGNVLTNALLNNINLEGGGRVWLPQGEQNAPIIRRDASRYRGIITDPNYSTTGIHPIVLRDGMFTRAIDALTSPITIKLDVTFNGAAGANNIRVVGRRMVPGAPAKSNPGAAGAKPVTTQAGGR